MQIRIEPQNEAPLKEIAARHKRCASAEGNIAIEAHLTKHRAACAAGKKMPSPRSKK